MTPRIGAIYLNEHGVRVRLVRVSPAGCDIRRADGSVAPKGTPYACISLVGRSSLKMSVPFATLTATEG